jgi:hypothetical protein
VTVNRWIAAILGLFNAANGLAMLFASSTWWASVPGVSDTGPFNPHFVQDVGAAADLASVILPAALAVYSAFPTKGEQHAQVHRA